jgi:hypothetical protein
VLGIAMAGGGLLVDGAGARVAWAAAGVVYLLSTVLAFALTPSSREERRTAAASVSEPGAAEPTGLDRIRALMDEIDEAHQREHERRRSDAGPTRSVGDAQAETFARRGARLSD